MTRPAEQRAEVLELREAGWNRRQIAYATGIPRSTVRGWLAGRVPSQRPTGGGICTACGHPAHPFAELDESYAYLLGLYLGDGCISAHPRRVFKLRITLDLAYPEIVSDCEAAMAAVMPNSKVGRYNRRGKGDAASRFTHVDVGSYSRAWPCLLPQHGPGPKHRRSIVLARWQETIAERHAEQLVRGLIHSDGCRFINTGTNWRHPRYVFNNTSADIREIFKFCCDLLGLHHTEAPKTVYVSRKADVAKLDAFIGPKR